MSLQDEVTKLREDMSVIANHLKDETVRRVKKKSWNLPFGVKLKGRRAVKQGKFLAIVLRQNHKLEFKVANVVGGLIEVDKTSYKAYEDGAVYFYKKFPVVIILDWRLTLVGGMTDFKDAVAKDITSFAQQTMVRVIEKTEVEKDLGKKKGRLSVGVMVVIVGIIIYIISQGLGGSPVV